MHSSNAVAMYLIDINECNDTELVHQCDHTCINTIGSYTCTCNSGYDLDVDGRTCNGMPMFYCSYDYCV